MTGLARSNAFSDPKRSFARAPSATLTRGLSSTSAYTRSAAPKIVSPSRKGLRNSVLSLRDGLVLTATQRVYYVSQRANDSLILGLTAGLRARLYHLGRATIFGEFAVGISDTSVAAPPRGTRFNYLALGAGGVTVRVASRAHLLAGLRLLHLSNASLKGPGRNPDIEAVGPFAGLLLGS